MAPPCQARSAAARGGSAAERGCVEDERAIACRSRAAHREVAERRTVLEAAADRHRLGALHQREQRRDRLGAEAAVAGLRAADDARFGDGDAERNGDALRGGDLELAGAGAKARRRRRARPRRRARGCRRRRGDDRDPPCRHPRQAGEAGRNGDGRRRARRLAHRAATIASGSEVTGAASSVEAARRNCSGSAWARTFWRRPARTHIRRPRN